MSSWRPTALGIDWYGDRIRLALVELAGREAIARRLVDVAVPDAPADEQERVTAAVVARAIRDERLDADVVVLGTPAAGVTVRRISVPVTGDRKVAAALAYAMEPLIPFTAEEIVADCIPIGPDSEGGTDLLAFAARRDGLAQRIRAFRQAGIAPDVLAPDLVPLLDGAPGPGAPEERDGLLYLTGDRGFLAVREGGRTVEFRALHGPVDAQTLQRDAVRTLMALQNDRPLARLYLGGEAVALADVAATVGVAAREVAFPAPATVSDAVIAAVGDWAPWTVALGLAAQGIGRVRHAVNFCRGDLAPRRGATWFEPARRLAVLAGVTLLVYSASLAMQRWALASQQRTVRERIQHLFEADRPDVTKLDQARTLVSERTLTHEELEPFLRPGPNVLEALAACDAAIRDVPGIQIESVSLTGDTLRLTGEVADFGAVSTLERALGASPLLAEVRTGRADEARGGAANFRIIAKLNPAGRFEDVKLPAAAPAPAQPPPLPQSGPAALPGVPPGTTATPPPKAAPNQPFPSAPQQSAPASEPPPGLAFPAPPEQTAPVPEAAAARESRAWNGVARPVEMEEPHEAPGSQAMPGGPPTREDRGREPPAAADSAEPGASQSGTGWEF